MYGINEVCSKYATYFFNTNKREEEKNNERSRNLWKPWGCTHTHTHTSLLQNRFVGLFGEIEKYLTKINKKIDKGQKAFIKYIQNADYC